eukprot:scaffold62535_cov16-Tisochrysis_lutea.AAC.2
MLKHLRVAGSPRFDISSAVAVTLHAGLGEMRPWGGRVLGLLVSHPLGVAAGVWDPVLPGRHVPLQPHQHRRHDLVLLPLHSLACVLQVGWQPWWICSFWRSWCVLFSVLGGSNPNAHMSFVISLFPYAANVMKYAWTLNADCFAACTSE